MILRGPAQTAFRRAPATLRVGVVVLATLVGAVGCRSLAAPSSAAAPIVAEPSEHRTSQRVRADEPLPPRGERERGLGVADGEVPDDVTVFDDRYLAVAKLDPALLTALRRAAAAAAGDGIEFYVNSGWRSPAYQQHLLDEAVSRYGSRSEAARWVATPETSPHVSGEAVDIGRSDATSWLSVHGAAYGLCQIYENEPWHYELRPQAVGRGCPTRYADPAHDPRMQR